MHLNDYNISELTPGSTALATDQWEALLTQLPNWSIDSIDGVPQLRCVFKFANFVEAIGFANKVGEIAELADHHPSLLVKWGQVQIAWWSHNLNGLHLNDFIIAAKTHQVYQSR